jgi:hypothetical protein
MLLRSFPDAFHPFLISPFDAIVIPPLRMLSHGTRLTQRRVPSH